MTRRTIHGSRSYNIYESDAVLTEEASKNMMLYEKIRQQKLMSTALLLVTLSVGIVIGTLVNTGVNAARSQNAPDATPLVIPRVEELGNEFSKLARKLDPSVVNITADYTPKPGSAGVRRRG